jgi:hypothetical protein
MLFHLFPWNHQVMNHEYKSIHLSNQIIHRDNMLFHLFSMKSSSNESWIQINWIIKSNYSLRQDVISFISIKSSSNESWIYINWIMKSNYSLRQDVISFNSMKSSSNESWI